CQCPIPPLSPPFPTRRSSDLAGLAHKALDRDRLAPIGLDIVLEPLDQTEIRHRGRIDQRVAEAMAAGAEEGDLNGFLQFSVDGGDRKSTRLTPVTLESRMPSS